MDPELPLDAFGSISTPTGAPMDSSSAMPGSTSASTDAAADPSAGAGWKQNLKGIGDAFNNTIGSLRVSNGQLGPGGGGGGQGQGQKLAPTPNPNQGPASPGGGAGQPTLAQQAMALLQKGLLSQEQYQKVMASIGGSVPSTGMPEMIAGQSTPGMGGSPFAAAQNPVNGPSPISPAWGG